MNKPRSRPWLLLALFRCGAACGVGSLASILSSNFIRLQLSGANQVVDTRTVLKDSSGRDSVPVQLCTASNGATELSIGGSGVTYGLQELINLVGIMDNLNFILSFYLRTLLSYSLKADTYSGTLNMLTKYNICTSIGLSFFLFDFAHTGLPALLIAVFSLSPRAAMTCLAYCAGGR